MRGALVLLLVLVPAAGCIDALDPKTGPAIAVRCDDADSDPGKAVSFAKDVQPIFDARCKFCHYPTGAAPIGLETTGLDLSSQGSILAGAAGGVAVVVPGQPCSSILYGKVSPGPPFGSRMPLNGPPFLSDQQLQLIHDWIAEGALAN